MKKILCLILCCFLILGITGCENNNSTENKKENNSLNSNVQEDNDSSATAVKKVYYCTEKDDDDVDYYFYYENNELTKVELTSIYVSDYSEIKEEAEEEYTGVKVSKQNGKVLVEVDILNGGEAYLYGETPLYEDESKDTSWNNISKIMNNRHTCVEQ